MKSVMKQTFDCFECIIVDDASPDDSIAKCEKMIEDYEGAIHFRILHHDKNRGLSAARNTGIDAATGDYLLFMDSDDQISSDSVEKLVAPVLKDDGIEMVIGEQLRFTDDGLLENQKKSWRHQIYLQSLKDVRDFVFDDQNHFPPAAWNKLVSRKFVLQHQLLFKEGQIWEDFLWTFFVMKHLTHLYVIPDVTYFYYKRADSISYGTKKQELLTHWCVACSIISSNLTLGEESREASNYLWGFCHRYVRLPKNKDFHETAKRFSNALPFRKYYVEKMLLWVTCVLPRNRMGKNIFKFIYQKSLDYRGLSA